MMPLFQPDQYLGRVIGQASECNEKNLFSDTKLGVVMKRQQGEMQRCIGTDGCVAPWTAGRLCCATAMARRCWSEGNQAAVSRHNAWKWERPRVSDGSCERHECRSRIETATELRRRPFRGHLRITQDSGTWAALFSSDLIDGRSAMSRRFRGDALGTMCPQRGCARVATRRQSGAAHSTGNKHRVC